MDPEEVAGDDVSVDRSGAMRKSFGGTYMLKYASGLVTRYEKSDKTIG